MLTKLMVSCGVNQQKVNALHNTIAVARPSIVTSAVLLRSPLLKPSSELVVLLRHERVPHVGSRLSAVAWRGFVLGNGPPQLHLDFPYTSSFRPSGTAKHVKAQVAGPMQVSIPTHA